MIVYFADRYMNILGMASTQLPEGLTIVDDLKRADIDSGVATFECTISYRDEETQADLKSWAAVGNYILRSDDDENEFYTIIDYEKDSKKQEVLVYAEDAGLDLLNEVVGAYEADKDYSVEFYINKYIKDSGFIIGINEIPKLSRKLKWEGESTVTERLASIATQFGGCEISYSFEIERLEVKNKYVNIYKQRGKDVGIELRLNRELDKIVTKESIKDLATALQCTGGTPKDAENPITLKGYTYDDGDFYVDKNGILKSREAVKKWGRIVGNKKSHIVKQYTYDAVTQKTLCAHAITNLKKIREIEVNYEVDINGLLENVKIGDRVNIIDDSDELYVSARVLELEKSVVNQTYKATIGEYIIKKSGIHQKVADMAAEFAKMAVSVTRAQNVAVASSTKSDTAKANAELALAESEKAKTEAEQAKNLANTATESSSVAVQKASEAKTAVEEIEKNVSSMEITVNDANTAAQQAKQSAEAAEQKADEANKASETAISDAALAKQASVVAKESADSAITKAADAQNSASLAVTDAKAAKTTAENAKSDAEQARKDISALGENLETIENTMQVDYARKTELTEAKASLQSQISQNAAQISSTVSKMTLIDETANNAAELAAQAQTKAESAQTIANKATTDAQTAQKNAESATLLAQNAQKEADAAKTAASTAQTVADAAEANLALAQADLLAVQGRMDATEEELEAAQAKVTAAETAANKAKADAASAVTKASDAQAIANTASTNASNAQTIANDAVKKAELAQGVADAAQGDAANAITKAQEAVTAAANAKTVADTAKANAQTAQETADLAKENALLAQTAADTADEKAAQAQTDLNAAKQNLAAVTSRVDATEEEIEAAQTAVVKAQTKANEAAQAAATAQSTANMAKTNAANAQVAADTAKTAADNAKKDADAAQTVADNAKAAVDALTIRVTKAETKITQNSDEIELRASKTEMQAISDDLAKNYYTKKETNSLAENYYTAEQTNAAITLQSDSIKQEVSKTYQTKEDMGKYSTTEQMNAAIITKANSITSSVSQTYATKAENQDSINKANAAQSTANSAQSAATNAQSTANTAVSNAAKAQATADGIEVGGRNLLAKSDYMLVRDKTAADGVSTTLGLSNYIELQNLIGRTLTLSAYYNTPGDSTYVSGAQDFQKNRFGCYIKMDWTDSTGTKSQTSTYGDIDYTLLIKNRSNEIVSNTFDVIPPSGYDTLSSLILYLHFWARPADTNNAVWTFARPKLEFGNRATDWTPAPEDVSSDIEEVQRKANDNAERIIVAESTIQQLSNMIASLVKDEKGTSLMTQTSSGWTFNIGSIQQSLTNAHTNIATINSSIAEANNVIQKLNNIVNDISNKTAYITLAKDSEGNPCIELGRNDNDFKVRITNTSLDFIEGTSKVAWINNKTLFITKATIKEELQIGETKGFMWKIRENGNMGLIPIG